MSLRKVALVKTRRVQAHFSSGRKTRIEGSSSPFVWLYKNQLRTLDGFSKTWWSCEDCSGRRLRPAPPGRIAYLAFVPVGHRVAVECGERCSIGNHRLREQEDERDGQFDSNLVWWFGFGFHTSTSRPAGGGLRPWSKRRLEASRPCRACKLRCNFVRWWGTKANSFPYNA